MSLDELTLSFNARLATVQEMVWKKIFLKGREKSRSFILNQGKLT